MGLFKRLFGNLFSSTEESTEPQQASSSAAGPTVDQDVAKATAPLVSDETAQLHLQTRPLEPPREFKTGNRRIQFGAATDVGMQRSNNQDSAYSMVMNLDTSEEPPPLGLFIVADGMGGHTDGEKASAATVRTIAEYFMEEIAGPALKNDESLNNQKTIPEVLADAMTAANEVVQISVPSGGTTATAAVIRGDIAHIAHVGDSRAYLLNEGTLEVITRDHSLVRRLIELGQLTEEEAEVHPQRNVLYRAIGQGERIDADTATRRLPPGSRLVLCSDGLWGVVGDSGIARILEQFADPQMACDALIDAANAGGGHDNITVVIIQMPD
jgi:protein phosphatase